MLQKFLEYFFPTPDIEYFYDHGFSSLQEIIVTSPFEELPLELIILIASFLELKDLLKLTEVNKKIYAMGNTFVPEKLFIKFSSTNSYSDIVAHLNAMRSNENLAKKRLPEIKDKLSHANRCPPDGTPVTCFFAILCWLASSLTIGLGAPLYYSDNEVLIYTGVSLLGLGTVTSSLGVISNIACCTSIFWERKYATLENEFAYYNKLEKESRISIKTL